MAFEDETDRRRKTEHPQKADSDITPETKKKRGRTPEFGQALRAAYQQTVNEDIPPEFHDLLGKLG